MRALAREKCRQAPCDARARDSGEPEAMSRLELLHRVGLRGLDIETSISSDARCERGQPRLEKPEARASCAAPCRAVAPLAARCARLRVTPTRRRPPRFFALSLKHRDVWNAIFEQRFLDGKWEHGNSDSRWTGQSCIAHTAERSTPKRFPTYNPNPNPNRRERGGRGSSRGDALRSAVMRARASIDGVELFVCGVHRHQE